MPFSARERPKSQRSANVRHLSRLADAKLTRFWGWNGNSAAKVVHSRGMSDEILRWFVEISQGKLRAHLPHQLQGEMLLTATNGYFLVPLRAVLF